MAATIQIKRASDANANSAPTGNLAAGELAVSYGNGPAHDNSGGRLFIGNSGGTGNIVIGGQYFAGILDHTPGTLTASSALIADSNSKLGQLKVDNLDLNGNTIISTDSNGDINLTPNGTGKTVISNVYVGNTSTSLEEYIEDISGGSVTAGEGIDVTYDDSAGTITVAGEDATDSNKGIASFNATDFTVSSGAVTVNAERIQDIAGAMVSSNTETNITVTYEDSDGTIDFSLNNTSVTAGSYGSTTAIPTFTVDAQGRLTAAGTASIATSLDIAADTGNDNGVALGTDTLTIAGGEGIDTSVSGDTITIAGELASTSNIGVAKFNSADFAVSGAGDVTIHSVSNAQLAGSIANSKLANDGITIGSDDTSLGSTITDLNGLTSVDVDNLTIDGNTISVTNTDGNLVLTPNGTGTVTVPTGYKDRSQFGANSLATKAYVDATKSGLDIKDSVVLATTAALATLTYSQANGTLTGSGNGSINASSGLGQSVTLAANDRILVKDQAESRQNGIYVVTTVGGSESFVLTRADDANSSTNFTGGSFVFVEQGTNANNGYVFTHDDEPTLTNATLSNNTQLPVSQFSGAGQIVAGDGLTKSANTINAVGTSNRISVSANAIDISTSYVGQNTITTLGTITTGTWNGSTIAPTKGGTGLTTAAKGSVLVANSDDVFSALDGGGSDAILFYTGGSDTISWATSLDGGTF